MPAVSTPTSADSPGYAYDPEFLGYSQRISAQSAKRITTLMYQRLTIESVLDVGCAQGTWLNCWNKLGIDDFAGVDGDYVVRERLEIPAGHFTAQDVSQPFDLERQFDVVQCLEVAEHIPADGAATLVDNLVRHGQCILFSAAPPGQGGEYHVNEQPYDYWREMFRSRDYVAFDTIRPSVRQDSGVAVWYRNNTILYVHRSVVDELPAAVRDTMIPEERPIPDISPWPYRVRKAMVRCLPARMQLALAKIVARVRG